jgi:N-acetylneuraminic acid mutarotase
MPRSNEPNQFRPPWRALLASGLALAVISCGEVKAHFLWLTCEREAPSAAPVVHAFLSETPVPAGAEFLTHIEKAKITADGQTLSWSKQEDTYSVSLPNRLPKIIDGFCDLGVMKRGETSFRLLYTARVQFEPVSDSEPEARDLLRARLIRKAGQSPVVVVSFRGKPVASAVVKAYPEVGDPIELKTDQEGRINQPAVAEGRTGLLIKWIENAPGALDGKSYAEVRHYATLTVALAARPPAAAASAAPFALLPEAVNSFGGAVLGDWLYVYSGHVGDTHKYDNNTTSKHFRRLNLSDRQTWEELPFGPPLQGLTLVAGGDQLYRIGGMSVHQAPGKPAELISVADFARFDPTGKTWTELPALPKPRSTHDAVVSGGKIYVVGGWAMHGGDSVNSEWLEDALVFDLSQKDAQWEKLETPPFQRRALAVAAIKGKLYVFGGLEEDGNVVKSVEIYDPAKKAWAHGPELPGSKLQGFSPSAFGIGDKLYVSGIDGLLHKLSDTGDRWDVAGKFAVPRLTHRLLPGIAGDLLAVGGNFAGSPVRFVESINVKAARAEGPKVVCWPVSLDTQARQAQAVGLFQSALIIAGGNRTTEPHALSASNLVRDAVKISLGSLEAASWPALPEPRQSAEVVVAQNGRKSELYILGGIGPHGEVSRTRGDAFRFDVASSRWTKLEGVIPDRRGMFRAAVEGGAIWLFGGNIWDGDMSHPGSMPNEVLRWALASEKAAFVSTGKLLPRPRRSFAGAVLGKKYYLVGGLGADMKIVSPVDVFDFESGQWSTIAAPKPRLFGELAELGGKLYLAGGYRASKEGHFEPAKSMEVYDPATSSWSTILDSLPVSPEDLKLRSTQGRLLLYSLDRDTPGSCHLALVAP